METTDRTQLALTDLGDWINSWREDPELLALVSPVARAWLDFANQQGETSDPERRSELARVIRLPVRGDG